MAFQPDEDVQKMAEAYAQDAVDYAGRARIELDWTDQSIVKVEEILDRLYKMKPQANPSPEQVLKFAKMFGSYIGETYRRSRNHDAKWGIVTFDGEQFVGMSTGKSGVSFWPWGRVQNRLDNGDEDNVWHYYKLALPD